MNYPFIQILRYEWNVNKKMWIITSVIGIALMFLSGIFNGPINKTISFSVFYMITLIFTLLSYQETTSSQSMSLYHLIPVDRNIKFLSKIILTLIAFPGILFVFRELFSFAGMFARFGNLNDGRSSEVWEILASIHFTNLLFAAWFLSQSVCTLVAIVFKKYKILWALPVLWGIQILQGSVLFIISSITYGNNSSSNLMIYSLIVIAILIYGVAYRLFFRRQL
jgi:hypothetical protein